MSASPAKPGKLIMTLLRPRRGYAPSHWKSPIRPAPGAGMKVDLLAAMSRKNTLRSQNLTKVLNYHRARYCKFWE